MRRDGRCLGKRRTAFLTFSLACLLSFCALWVSGFDPLSLGAGRQNHHSAPAAAVHQGRRLHGPVSVVQPQPIGTDSSVSTASLRLILTAARPGRNAMEGYAELGVSAASPQTYKAGALLANGARIAEIYRDYIVLERDGQKTHLYVEGQAPPDYRPAFPALVSVGSDGSKAAAMADSHDALTDAVRVSPLYQGDSLQALEVYSSRHSSAFEQWGLEPGDRITAIDGQPLGDVPSAFKALRRLPEGDSVHLRIERQGVVSTLSVDGSILASRKTDSNEEGITR